MNRGQGEPLLTGLGRAFGGAILFALPLMMTMELWRLAHSIPRYRFALLVLATVLLVVGLSRYFGAGTGGIGVAGYLADAGVALLAAALAAGAVLTVLAVADPLRSWPDAMTVIGIEALPASVGAAYARSQLGQGSRRPGRGGYGYELFLMTAGAVVLAANIAPTEEVVLLAAEGTPVHTLLLVGLSVVLMHGFVYTVGFRGQHEAEGFVRSFFSLTVVGYLMALAVSSFLLWTFGRFDGVGPAMAVSQAVVLGFPASVGAAAARLIL